MWCPICDKVELERPLLKRVYEEIMNIFDDVIKTMDFMYLDEKDKNKQ